MSERHAELLALIAQETNRILTEKGEAAAAITADTAFLDGPLPFDSLDLATLIVALEGVTGKDPFRSGFRQFTKAGELAALYDDA
jgi:acyl carrier protein